jgi:hypothetical protein
VPVSESSQFSESSESSESSEPSAYPKALLSYSVSRISIPVLNIYLRQTYSSLDCDEDERRKTKDESLKTITKCIKRCIMLMLKRLCRRDYVEEIMWKRLCGRDYVEEIMWKRLCERDYVKDIMWKRRGV